MNRLSVETRAAQATRQGVSDHHGAMSSARATYADSDIRLSFAFVKRQKIIQQVAETAQGLFNFRFRLQILHNTTVMAGEGAQFRHEKWIRQMAHIKEQLQLRRAAILVPEAED